MDEDDRGPSSEDEDASDRRVMRMPGCGSMEGDNDDDEEDRDPLCERMRAMRVQVIRSQDAG